MPRLGRGKGESKPPLSNTRFIGRNLEPQVLNLMNPYTDDHPIMKHGFECFNPDLHSSSVALLQTCPRKYMYVERFHLQPKGHYSPALGVGTFYHAAMENLLRGNTWSTTEVDLERRFQEQAEEINGSGDELGLLPNGKATDSLIYGMETDLALAKVMAHWSWQFAPLPGVWKVLSVEETIRLQQVAPHPALRGTLDLVVENETTGEIWIVDHKTTSWDPQTVTSSYSFALQPRVYKLLGSAVYPKIMGVIHNVIKKPTIRQKKSQTWDEYLDEVREWYSGTGKWSKYAEDRHSKPMFVRSYVRFDETADEETRLQLDEASTAARAFPNLDRFYRNSNACMNYNSLCPYHDLCSQNPDNWEDTLKLRYEVSHRDDNTVVDLLKPRETKS